jgi:hypothetical protein
MPIIIYILLALQRVIYFAIRSISFKPLKGPKAFIIKAGHHYHKGISFRPVVGKEMNFIVTFDNSAIYESNNPVNQWDINKLWGFTEGFSEANSARVGWNYKDDSLYLHPFVQLDGIFPIDPPEVKIPIGKPISCSIRLDGLFYVFILNGVEIRQPRASNSSRFYGFQCYPYFGGNEVATQDIKILIESK